MVIRRLASVCTLAVLAVFAALAVLATVASAAPSASGFLDSHGALDLAAIRAAGFDGPLDLHGLTARLDGAGAPVVTSGAAGDRDPEINDGPVDNYAGIFDAPGTNGQVLSMTVWNGDLIVGGFFSQIGTLAANNIARWDGVHWYALGTGLGGGYSFGAGPAAMTTYNGKLIVSGFFTTAGGITTNYIAQWDGTTWSSLGGGMTGGAFTYVRALAVYQNKLYAAGLYTAAGGTAASNIAAWDGVSWSTLGAGVNDTVYVETVWQNKLVVAGQFTTAGGAAANRIAAWDGTTWTTLGSGTNSGIITVYPTADSLLAGGFFTQAGGATANHIASWNGTAWSTLGNGFDQNVNTLTQYNSQIWAGGVFTLSGAVSTRFVSHWTGSAWATDTNSPNNAVTALETYNGRLWAGGAFPVSAAGDTLNNLANFDGTTWRANAFGFGAIGGSGIVYCYGVYNGELYVGGQFASIGGKVAANIAKWNGEGWTALGAGTNGIVFCLGVYNNILYAGGAFTLAGGATANRIASWNGTAWASVGAGAANGTNGNVTALAAYNSLLYVGGLFTQAGGAARNRIATWSGTAWGTLGTGANQFVGCFTVLNSLLYIGGNFTTMNGVAANRIASYNGTTFAALGTGCSGAVNSLTAFNGQLAVGGAFATAGGAAANNLALWTGSAWTTVGPSATPGVNATVNSVTVYNSTLVFAGAFGSALDGTVMLGIGRWNGSSFSALAGGISAAANTVTPFGSDLWIGGGFTTAGLWPSRGVGRWNDALPSRTYTITASAGANGTISPSGVTVVNWGGSQVYTMTPSSGFFVSDVLVDGVSAGTVGSYTFSPVTANHIIAVSFYAPYTLTYTAGPGGTLAGTTPQTLLQFANGSPVTAVPTAGNIFTGWSDGSVANPRQELNVRANIAVTASFACGIYDGYGAKTDYQGVNLPHWVAAGDVNADGHIDIVFVDDNSKAGVFLGTGTGSFGTATYYTTGTRPECVVLVDVNGDHIVDMLVANELSNTVSVFLGIGTGTFGPKTDFATGSGTGFGPRNLAVVDVNADGKFDLITTNYATTTISVLLGTGTGSFGAKTNYTVGSFPFDVAVGDVNADGKPDLAVTNSTPSTVSVLLGTGTGTFGAKTDFATGTNPSGVAIGDVNGDGKPDLVVGNNINPGTVSVLLGTGTGSFGAVTSFPSGAGPFHLVLVDVTGDGKADAVTANWEANSVSVLPGNGTGGFGATTDFPVGTSASAVAIADFNGDGKADIVSSNYNSGNVSVLLGKSQYTLTYTAGAGGTLSGATSQTVAAGGNGTAVTAVPNSGFAFAAWSDGVLTATRTDLNVIMCKSVSASFVATTYSLTASAGANGTIAPSGVTVVNSGGSQAYTMTPNASYHVLGVLVDGVSVGAVTTYTFTNVTANHTISVTFESDPVAVLAATLPTPTRLAVAAALPNPFSHRLDLLVGTPARGRLSVTILDAGGRQVAALAPQAVEAGYAAFTWNGKTASGQTARSGVYVVRVESGATVATRRIVKVQ